ncbi:hypothetical protein AAH978_10870 [Streptomyces sp. ZYX-F-203]
MFSDQDPGLPGWRGGDGNAAYLDKTLRFTDIETRLNETVGIAQIFFLFARAFVVSLVAFGVAAFFGLFLLIGGGFEAAGAWMTLSSFGCGALFWLVVLLSREPEPIAEWRVLLAEREGRKEHAHEGIRKVLRARGFPVRVTEEQGRLVLRERGYVAYISVFGYGTSLYLGWMMWRSRRGYQLIGRLLGDMWESVRGQNQIDHQILRSERARAMREAVHMASREGLMVALEDAGHESALPEGLPGARGLGPTTAPEYHAPAEYGGSPSPEYTGRGVDLPRQAAPAGDAVPAEPPPMPVGPILDKPERPEGTARWRDAEHGTRSDGHRRAGEREDDHR